jgi:hypothetical protein
MEQLKAKSSLCVLSMHSGTIGRVAQGLDSQKLKLKQNQKRTRKEEELSS